MHLVVLENEPSSRRGGQELSLLEVCEGLCRKGHTLTLLHTQDGDLLPRYRKLAGTVQKVSAYHIRPKSDPRAWARFAADLMRVRAPRGSVIYSNQYHDTLFGSALARLRRVPFVCQVRLRPPLPFCGQWKIGLKGVTRFIAISDRTRQEWVQAGIAPERIDRVYNGVDTSRFTPAADAAAARARWALKTDDFVVAFVGRLDRDKGIETLLDAAKAALVRQPQLKLLIAGKPHDHPSAEAADSYRASLEDRVRQNGLSERVRFTGHVADPLGVYQASDALVLPTRISEAFGRVLIEAMACGVPAAASRLGGVPEVLAGEWSRFLFEPGSAAQLAERLNDIAELKSRDPKLPERCRQYASEKFPLAATIDGIEACLLKALSS